MYRVTTSFLQGEVATFSHGRKKAPTPWKQPEGGNKPSFKKGFKNKHMSNRKPDRFSLLTKTPKEIFALEKRKFKAPPPMNDKPKAPKKGDTTGKERPLAILMIQPWEKVAKQKITQSFSPETTISFPPLGDEDGTKGPMIIKAEKEGDFVSPNAGYKENPCNYPRATWNAKVLSLKEDTVPLRTAGIIPMDVCMPEID
ncbi:hypothetical protein Tco_0175488 [Tanacetum coccineum]